MAEILDEKMQKVVKKLIDAGKKRNQLTYDEVGEKLAVECEAGVDQMEEALRLLEENGVKVVRSKAEAQLPEKIAKEAARQFDI